MAIVLIVGEAPVGATHGGRGMPPQQFFHGRGNVGKRWLVRKVWQSFGAYNCVKFFLRFPLYFRVACHCKKERP